MLRLFGLIRAFLRCRLRVRGTGGRLVVLIYMYNTVEATVQPTLLPHYDVLQVARSVFTQDDGTQIRTSHALASSSPR